jgi:DNA polymerase
VSSTPPPPSPAAAPAVAEATLFGGPGNEGELQAGAATEVPLELPSDEKPQALEALRARHDAECPHCTIADAHTRTVFGEGDPDAALMFIGEAPGEEEDRTGRPFVGRAGRKLDEMITAMGMQREDVYIANILKSRPPNNRAPQPGEVVRCSPYLADQIRIIRPTVIVGLGGPATKWLLRTTEGITRLRGTWGVYVDGALRFDVMPTFHPAYLLRNYTLETRSRVWSDMRAVMAKLETEAI